MKSIAALALISSAAAFAPAPVSKVGSSLDYAKELDSMPTSVECPKVVRTSDASLKRDVVFVVN